MIYTAPKYVHPLSLSGIHARKSPSPHHLTNSAVPEQTSQPIFPANMGPLIFQTIDVDSLASTPIPYKKPQTRGVLKTSASKRPQAANAKVPSNNSAVKGTRTISSNSLLKQRKRTGTPNMLTDETFSHFPEYTLMVGPRRLSPEPGKTRENTDLDRTKETRSFSPMKTSSQMSIGQVGQTNKVSYQTLKNKKEYKNNLFTVTASRLNVNHQQRESVSRQKTPNITIQRIHSMKRDESVSGHLETTTNVYDSLRASFAMITQENQSNRIKDIEDLDELVDHIKSRQTEFGIIYGEKIVSSGKNSSVMLTLPGVTTGPHTFKKNYSNLDKLLSSGGNGSNVIEESSPKSSLPQAPRVLNTKKPVEKEAKDDHKQNFMRTIYRGLRKSGKYHLDSNFMTSCEENRTTFKRRVQSITFKNLNSFMKEYSK